MSPQTDIFARRDLLLLKLEGKSSAAERAEIADSLCDLASEAAVSLRSAFDIGVVRLLADKQTEVRCAGLALASLILKPSAAKDILVRHVTDEIVRVRVEAAGRLADLELPEARGALAAVLQDVSLNVRFEAARGMAMLGHAAGFEVLVEALDDVDLRFRAASALAVLGKTDAIIPLKRAFSSWFLSAFDKTQLAGALAVLGDADGLAHLLRRTTRKWSMDRSMAVELLGEINKPETLSRLFEIVQDVNDAARGAAARALGKLAEPKAEAVLVQMLESGDVDEQLKLDAAEGLLLLGSVSGRERVKALQFTEQQAKADLATMLEDYAP